MFFIFSPIVIIILFSLFVLFFQTKTINWRPLSDYKNKIKFKEHLIISLIVSSIVSGLMFGISISKMYFNEIWNFKISSIKYEEKWTKMVSYTVQVYTGSDSKGRPQYRTEVRHRTDTFGPYWKNEDEYGVEREIDKDCYEKWKLIWNNEKKIGENKGSAVNRRDAITGGIFQCKWPDTFETLYPFSITYRYKNKVRCSNSVLKYKEPTKELIKKYPRPADVGNFNSIICFGTNVDENNLLFMRRINSSIGPINQIHVIWLLFDTSYERDVVEDILSAWCGPNKNELLIFLSVDKENVVRWIEAHSWMDNTAYHAMICDEFSGKKLNFIEFGNYIKKTVHRYWKRKEFKDFDYLQIDISPLMLLITIILLIGVNFSSILIVEKINQK